MHRNISSWAVQEETSYYRRHDSPPLEGCPHKNTSDYKREFTPFRSRAVSFLKMTNARHIAMHFLILAVLLFMGESQFFPLHYVNFKGVFKLNIKILEEHYFKNESWIFFFFCLSSTFNKNSSLSFNIELNQVCVELFVTQYKRKLV